MLKYDRKELAKFYVGCPVEFHTSMYEYSVVGHVTGFSLNCLEEVVINIDGMDGQKYLMHPIHITLLTE